MRRNRFVGPPRERVGAGTFDHPIYAEYRFADAWLGGVDWPSLEELDAAVQMHTAEQGVSAKRLVSQTPDLLADGLHYEQRIAERDQIATREANWHDLFNALIWIRHPAIKRAMNVRHDRIAAPATR